VRIGGVFRRHLTLVGLCAVLVPIVAIVAMQYQALSRLEETSPAARRQSLESRLAAVAADLDRDLLAGQRQALVLGPSALVSDSYDDDVSVFRTAPTDGIKRYFLASLYPGKRKSKVTTYDPATGTFHDTWETPEMWVAFSASFHSLNLMMDRTVVDPEVVEVDEKDANNRVALRPIVDGESRIVGVAGMIVDPCYVAQHFLPGALDASLKSHFSESELSELRVVVLDESGAQRLAGSGASAEPEVAVALPFVLSRWKLGFVPRGESHDQMARRYFAVNLTLTILMTAILAGAVVFSLRAAAREMRLSEMKTDFVSNVSHELRTPLASIRVFGELMRAGRVADPAKVHEYGELIETESRRLTRLVDNILDFSKIESGRKTYELDAIAPTELVDEALAAFAPHARQSGFDVAFDVPDPNLPDVRVDTAAVTQAILNLLDNAVKYSDASRAIVVRLEREGDGVAISVVDRGIGIPPNEQPHIFNRFHRVSSSLVHDVKGSGLGLALVKHVVEAHGGGVSVASRPGAGSVFTLHLPSATEAPQAPEQSRVEREGAAFRP
jgi:signal transduction histidine kinase